jgi:hypothetical protein
MRALDLESRVTPLPVVMLRAPAPFRVMLINVPSGKATLAEPGMVQTLALELVNSRILAASVMASVRAVVASTTIEPERTGMPPIEICAVVDRLSIASVLDAPICTVPNTTSFELPKARTFLTEDADTAEFMVREYADMTVLSIVHVAPLPVTLMSPLSPSSRAVPPPAPNP